MDENLDQNANYMDFSKTNEEEVAEIVYTSLNHQSNSDDKNSCEKKASFIKIARGIATDKSRGESSKDDVVTKKNESVRNTTTTGKNKSWNLVISPRGGVYEQFPVKLYQLLVASEVVGFQDIISWRSHGRSFKVHNPRQFEREILPKYTRQSKLTSFTRQLNLYGFQRLTRGHDCGAYYHELFLRNKPLLCRAILRTKIKGTGAAQQGVPPANNNKKKNAKKKTKKAEETRDQQGASEEKEETHDGGEPKQPAKEKAVLEEHAPEPDFYNDYPFLAPLSYPAVVKQQFYDHHHGAICSTPYSPPGTTKRNIIHVDGSTVIVPDGVTAAVQENKKARYDINQQSSSGIVVSPSFYSPPSSHDQQYHLTSTGTSGTPVPIVVQSNIQPQMNREENSTSPVLSSSDPPLTYQPVDGVKFLPSTRQEQEEQQVNDVQFYPQQALPSFTQQQQGFVVTHTYPTLVNPGVLNPVLSSDTSYLTNQITTEESSCTKPISTRPDETLTEDLDLIKEMVDDLSGGQDDILEDLTTIMTDFADDEDHAAITIPSLLSRDICDGRPDLNDSMLITRATDDSNTVMTDPAMETPPTSEPSSPRGQMKNNEVCDELLSKFGTLSTQSITNALLIIGWPSSQIDGAKTLRGGGSSHSSDKNKNRKKCVGRAVTLQFIPTRPDIIGDKPTDGGGPRPEYEAFEKCGPNEVLVMSSVGNWDSLEGTEMKFLRLLEERRCGGLVTDGSLCEKPIVEDDYDFPSFSYEPNTSLPQGSTHSMQPWKCNDIVNVGGISVRPGDIIVGDQYGIVCVPGTVAETVYSIAHGYENNKVN